MKNLLLIAFTCFLFSCKVKNLSYLPDKGFNPTSTQSLPYNEAAMWIAHPELKDYADSVPSSALSNNQHSAIADVFFVYPTIYTGNEEWQITWNSPVDNQAFNEKIGKTAILNQATVFNGSARIFAPLYRQAHLQVYFEENDQEAAKKAFELAYSDVREAFLYYLNNLNNNRPFFIAGHSQGTDHAERLIRELVLEDKISENFVAAYLIGRPVIPKEIAAIPPCEYETDTKCYVSWNVYKRGYYPSNWKSELRHAVATNPLNWLLTEKYAGYAENKGGLLGDFTIRNNLIDAQVHKGMIWVNKPNIFGGIFINRNKWHIAEYNLYYINIRENIEKRLDAWFRRL